MLLPALARAGGPRPGDPVLSFPLDTLGMDIPQPRLLTGGAVFFTVNFVDSTHLLLTFNDHGLIPRATDKEPGDDDHLIRALLLELPSGKVLASTQWHARDREQYLWPIGHGEFLLRIRRTLTLIEPLAGLAAGDPFHQQPFLDFQRRIGYLSVSPVGDLLVVETVPRRKTSVEEDMARLRAANAAPPDIQADAAPTPGLQRRTTLTVAAPPPDPAFDPHTEVRIFRMLRTPATASAPPRLVVQNAGMLITQNPIRVPATSEGFLDISRESARTWLFDFQSHSGVKKLELAPFDTTCAPTPFFISRSEFVALGCHGSDQKAVFSGFNFRGEEPWIMMLQGNNIAPLIVSSPDSGRLAFSHISLAASFYDLENLVPEEMSAQEIQVIQNHDGRILLHVLASPIQRAGQNFDLSPDGLAFTVIRNGNLEIYRLPPLTKKDEEQLKLAAADVPPPSNDRIRLTVHPVTASQTPAPLASDAPAQAAAATSAPGPAPASAPARPSAPESNAAVSQPDSAPATAPDEPRKPPSLYTPDYPKPPK
jgi:hypothetical protein